MSAGWRSKRTSRPSWRWICPAPRWWWATARPGRRWRRNIPTCKFLGALSGEALVRAYAGSDVFVFPSRTDTFGLVLLEALACGLPVAAYPVEGPRDVVGRRCPAAAPWRCWTRTCSTACLGALELARNPGSLTPRAFAESHSWRACTLQFLRNIVVEPDAGLGRLTRPRRVKPLAGTALSEPRRWARTEPRKPRYPSRFP